MISERIIRLDSSVSTEVLSLFFNFAMRKQKQRKLNKLRIQKQCASIGMNRDFTANLKT